MVVWDCLDVLVVLIVFISHRRNVQQVYCQVARGKKVIQHWFLRLLFLIHVRFCPYLLFSLVLIMTKQLHDLILLSMKYIMEVIQKPNGSVAVTMILG